MSGTKILSYRAALREALIEELERDPKVFVMARMPAPSGGSSA